MTMTGDGPDQAGLELPGVPSASSVASAPSIRRALAGKRILITGATGFVGEALLARIIATLPDTRAVLLVRPKGSLSGKARVGQLLKRPAFDTVRKLGIDVEEALERQVEIIESDLYGIKSLPGDLDIVVHCAGDVSFDPPIDSAFKSNVLGTRNLLEKIVAGGSRPHYVHVSTAYVAGRRRGAIPERSVEHDADWRVEAEHGIRMRERVEDASRTTAVLSKLRGKATREHGRAGPITVAEDTERRRREWVDETLVKVGGERATSLGWTDVYTFTKALGERVVEEFAAEHNLPVSIVRPSIIESALVTPYPGWIEGFKMAEPLILAYGRGELPEFPAAPDSIVDIVPVDHVVAALVAVSATPAEPAKPRYFHVSSSARNPLTFRRLYRLIREHFAKYPLQMGERGSARLAAWRFPGAEAVERLLASGERIHRIADKAVSMAPRSDRVRQLAGDLDRQRGRLEFLRRYMDLYQAYTQAELQFVDDATLGLFESLDAEERELFAFDTKVIDWPYYLRDVHCPSVTKPIRDLAARRANRTSRPATARRGLPEATDIVAAFDMDGTLMSSNVIETYLWMRLPGLDQAERAREIARVASRLPKFVRAERRDRGGFLRAVYRRYAGADLAELEALADEALTDHVLSRVSAAALRRVREHKAAGHRTVLITGAVRPLTRPLRPLFDAIVAADLEVDDSGRCTGFLASPPLVGEARSAWLRRYAEVEGFDLARSYGYADSHSDLPMLRAVGNPVAVSPDVPLWRHARRSRWTIENWSTPSSTSRMRLPEAPAIEGTSAR